MTAQQPADRLVFGIYRTSSGALQAQLAQLDANDSGHGYRLAGPKHYNRGVTSLLEKDLDERDAQEIRGMLDAVFPVAAADDHPADGEQPRPHPATAALAEVLAQFTQTGYPARAVAEHARTKWVPLTTLNRWRAIRDRAEAEQPIPYALTAQADTLTEPATPAVGDRYTNRHGTRTVTVTRVWTDDNDETCVAYEWRDSQPGACRSALNLDIFREHYQSEAQPSAAEESPADAARRYARRLAAVENLCSGHPGYHTITVKALLTAMSDADDDQAQPDPLAAADRAEVETLRAHVAELEKALALAGAVTPPQTLARGMLQNAEYRAHARRLAEQITALGKARGWSTWAADYIHPDREFVDTGVPEDQAQQCAGAAINHDETGICNHAEPQQ